MPAYAFGLPPFPAITMNGVAVNGFGHVNVEVPANAIERVPH
jgi:hypothetical protein